MPTEPMLRVMSRRLLLLCAYVLMAAAAFCGMYAKHAFGDGDKGTSLTAIMDGTAERPYVYRRLLPGIADIGAKVIPQRIQQRFLDHLALDSPAHNPLRNTFARSTSTDDPRYALRYYIVYTLSFIALVASMFMLRAICRALIHDPMAATLAPLAFALVVPASYYYDFPELFFMTVAVWFAMRGRLVWLVLLTAAATCNKESFPVFVVALYPFMRMQRSTRAALIATLACLAVGFAFNALVKLHYTGNPGQPALFNLWLNLRFIFNPRSYLLSEWTYGILLPKGFNVIILLMLVALVSWGWRSLPEVARRHALLAAAINVPLFVALGYTDEVRALSMLHVTATLLVCASLSGYLARAAKTLPAVSTRRSDAPDMQPETGAVFPSPSGPVSEF